MRDGFGSQALVLPLQHNWPKAIQARRGSPNKKDADPSMRHRHGADDGPTPGLWDDAAAARREVEHTESSMRERVRVVCPRVGALPRVPKSRASAPPTRTNRAFRKQAIEREPKQN